MGKLHNCVCVHCGAQFFGMKNQRYCSKKCSNAESRERASGADTLKASRKRKLTEAEKRAKSLAARDTAYASEYPELASGSVRGRIAAGGRCGMITGDGVGAIVNRFVAPSHCR